MDTAEFIFRDDKQQVEQTLAPYPSKPHDNIRSNTSDHEEHRPVNLYEYSMGIKNIEASHITYGESEVYVSKPLKVYGNVMEVELDALEEHPVFDELNGQSIDRQTSVEYYMSYKQRPTANDWIPILPQSTRTVKGERCLFEGSRANLRFPSLMNTIEVFENGVRMNRNDYEIMNNQEIHIPRRDTGSIYTVNYEPDVYRRNPHILQIQDYKDYTTRMTETFEGTDVNKTIHLEYTPFIDMEKVLQAGEYNPNTSDYQPIQVRLTNANIQRQGNQVVGLVEPYQGQTDIPFTYNKTLYKDKSWSQLQPYSLTEPYNGFDYYHHKNRLTFTEHFNVPRIPENRQSSHGNATIEVTYDALVTDFRLKMILRRNTAVENTATPKVKEYKIRFKTID